MDKLELIFFDNIKRLKKSKDFKEKFKEKYEVCNANQIKVEYAKELNQGYTKINNFYEFYVNDVPLSKTLDEFYNNSETMLNTQNSQIGYLNTQNSQIGYTQKSYAIDKLVINSFLNKPITDDDLKPFSSKQKNEEWFVDLIDEINKTVHGNDFFRFYICSVCGDPYCHMTIGKIIRSEKSFLWIFENFKNEKTLEFEFDSNEYIKVFNDYLKEKSTANNV